MPFKKIIKNLVESVPEATGAILADWEGEAVEHFSLYDDYELKVIGAHKGIIFSLMRDIHSKNSDPEPRILVIRSSGSSALIGSIDKDYSLVMTLSPQAVMGRALHRMQDALHLLKKEIC